MLKRSNIYPTLVWTFTCWCFFCFAFLISFRFYVVRWVFLLLSMIKCTKAFEATPYNILFIKNWMEIILLFMRRPLPMNRTFTRKLELSQFLSFVCYLWFLILYSCIFAFVFLYCWLHIWVLVLLCFHL
jgi:hypothetical protein